MVDNLVKPRLVFFQWKHADLPNFLKLHMQQHVKCLSEFFDLILVNEDCDYEQVCDRCAPDITLFESGYKTSYSRRISIKNTSTHPGIPKVGLHNGDSWCDCRVGFLSDMDHWGIDTYFTICTTTPEHTPQIANDLYIWPNCIDSDIYHDYGQEKVVHVLFNGNMSPLYAWRQHVYKLVNDKFPTLTIPHLGYENRSSAMIYGEQYAKTLNGSWVVPTCGTIAREVVRKHFEIPGCGSCLITERSEALEAAGFVDMRNCVFADDQDVLDKLNYLFNNLDKLQEITRAGYTLVQQRHTLKQRDQIYQWYCHHKNLKSGQRIVQKNPFENLIIVETSSGIGNTLINGNGVHLTLLRKGDENLWAGKYDEAETLYRKCLNYIPWMTEPKLKLTITNLYKGNPNEACSLITEPIINILRHYRAEDPDPVEWAYYIICLLCQGKLTQAYIRANQFPLLSHPELERTRWAVNCLLKDRVAMRSSPQLERQRKTVHIMPELSMGVWTENLRIMLNACGQVRYAKALPSNTSSLEANHAEIKNRTIRVHVVKMALRLRLKWLDQLNKIFNLLAVPDPRPGLPPISEMEYVVRLGRWAKMDSVKRYALAFKDSTLQQRRKLHG